MAIPPDDPVWIPATLTTGTRAGLVVSPFAFAMGRPANPAALLWLPDPAIAPVVGKQGYWGILVADTS